MPRKTTVNPTIVLFLVVTIMLLSNFFCGFSTPSRAESTKNRGILVLGDNQPSDSSPLYSGYYALVIGCASYKSWPQLPNPLLDAREVADALMQIGFEVNLLLDPDAMQLRRAINNLAANQGQNQELAILIYFAGHGYTLNQADGGKLGYIVPIDAPDPDKNLAGFMDQAVSMLYIEQISTLIRSKHVLICFDSCFSGALFSLIRAKPSRFIIEQVARPVRAFITAGDESEQVPDKSVFKTVFIQGAIDGYADSNEDGYITGLELGTYIQEKVVNYSNGSQHPQFGKIRNPKLDKGDFVFIRPKKNEPDIKVATVQPSSQIPQPEIFVEESSAAVGNLSFTSNLDQVAFELLGQKFQTMRGKWLTINNLPIGSYQLRIEHDGYETWEDKVTIKLGETTKVIIWLEKQNKEPDKGSQEREEGIIASEPLTQHTKLFEANKEQQSFADAQKEEIDSQIQQMSKIREIPKPESVDLPVPTEKQRSDERIDDLLAQAAKAYGEDRLTTPEGDSALDYYRQAFTLTKDDPRIYGGIFDVLKRYLEWTENALQKSQEDAAKSCISKAQKVIRSIPDPILEKQLTKMRELQKQLDMLIYRTRRVEEQTKIKPRPQYPPDSSKKLVAEKKDSSQLKKATGAQGGEEKSTKTPTQQSSSEFRKTSPQILREKLF